MATIRFNSPKGPVALVPAYITAISRKAGGTWIQDIHGHWWQSLDRSYDEIASDIDFILRKTP